MEATTAPQDAGILSDASNLASWTRQRTSEELRQFIDTRHALLPVDIDVE